MLQFGTDGVRGKALTELTESYSTALGTVAVDVLKLKDIVIGRDTRESGQRIESAFAAGCAASGARVHLLGVAPTPAIAAIASAQGFAGASITASHNEYSDNGIKIFAVGGIKLTSEQERAIESRLEEPSRSADRPAGGLAAASTSAFIDARSLLARYEQQVVQTVTANAFAQVHIVLDCANGAMSTVAPEVFAKIGAKVTVINCEPDGRNINADCGATHPKVISAAVRLHSADIGLAFDGDGDRVIAVDHVGNIVDGDHLIALAARDLRDLGQLADNTVVVTVMTNVGFHRAMKAEGINVVTTLVGDRAVLAELDARGYALGGEQSGHIIYRKLATTGDGLLAGVLLVDMVRRAGKPLQQLAKSAMTSYPQVLLNVKVAQRGVDVGDIFAAEVGAAQEKLGDTGRVLLRSSGTENLVRVMVEAQTPEQAQEIAENLAAVVAQRLG